jgi:hypothetical protein
VCSYFPDHESKTYHLATHARNGLGVFMQLPSQGNLGAALESYKASLAIRERLAEADPTNAGWQRDLAISYGRVGMMDAVSGQSHAALDNFRKGRDIIVLALVTNRK